MKSKIVLCSPFILIICSSLVAYIFKRLIGNWAFIPTIICMWSIMLYFIYQFGNRDWFASWLKMGKIKIFWISMCLLISFIPVFIFIRNFHLLNHWIIVVPWLVIALINPWVEEFYWRGLLLTFSKSWNILIASLYSSLLFASNHWVFTIHSNTFKGFSVFLSTLTMGFIWSICFKKTHTLIWVIISHFLVDFLNASVPAFLDILQ